MLVLTRRRNESIQIGNDVTVIVQRIIGGRVSIAIQAPKDVKIVRGEIPYHPQKNLDMPSLPESITPELGPMELLGVPVIRKEDPRQLRKRD